MTDTIFGGHMTQKVSWLGWVLGLVGGPFVRSSRSDLKFVEETLGNLFICFSSKLVEISGGFENLMSTPLFTTRPTSAG